MQLVKQDAWRYSGTFPASTTAVTIKTAQVQLEITPQGKESFVSGPW